MASTVTGVLRDLEFLCQAVVLFVVVITSIYNLSSSKDTNQPLWASLLSICVGLCVPGPTVAALRRREYGNELDSADTTEQQQYSSVSDERDLGLSGSIGQTDTADRRTI